MSAAPPGAAARAPLAGSCAVRGCGKTGFSSFCLLRRRVDRIQMALTAHTRVFTDTMGCLETSA